MITKLLNEVNEKIETLNNLVQDKEYFEKLDERIEKVNNYVQEQKQEIERQKEVINGMIDNEEKYLLEINRLNNIINELERRFNQELENNEKWDIEDTKQFYSKKWYKDTLNDFKNMIKN